MELAQHVAVFVQIEGEGFLLGDFAYPAHRIGIEGVEVQLRGSARVFRAAVESEKLVIIRREYVGQHGILNLGELSVSPFPEQSDQGLEEVLFLEVELLLRNSEGIHRDGLFLCVGTILTTIVTAKPGIAVAGI